MELFSYNFRRLINMNHNYAYYVHKKKENKNIKRV